MKLTKNSQLLINFFNQNVKENTCIKDIKFTKKTENILEQLYDDIMDSYESLQAVKTLHNKSTFYKLQIKKITNVNQIIKPKSFNSHFFPEIVRSHIDNHSMYTLIYTFPLIVDNNHVRNITVIFTIENDNANIDIEQNISVYNKYIEFIYMWLHILNTYSSKNCAQELTIYLYFSSLNKKLPDTSAEILDVVNINTAFTSQCSKISEIVIYRKEEWFKVFMHETFHNFGLDFSDMNNTECSARILKLFPVKSEVNLFESYCEFWAEIMNALFCSFKMLTNKYDFTNFLINCNKFINLEINYSLFQLVKTLNFMGLNYAALSSNKEYAKILRDNLYKENTNVLSYYVIRSILITNFQNTIAWCDTNNTTLLQFKKTIQNQQEFCRLIEKYYNSNYMIQGVSCMQNIWHDLLIKYSDKSNDKNNDKKIINTKTCNKKIGFIMNNLRMSLCELG